MAACRSGPTRSVAAPAPTGRRFKLFSGGRKLRDADLVTLIRELATLMQARLPLDRALATLADVAEDGPAPGPSCARYWTGCGPARPWPTPWRTPASRCRPSFTGMIRAGEAGGQSGGGAGAAGRDPGARPGTEGTCGLGADLSGLRAGHRPGGAGAAAGGSAAGVPAAVRANRRGTCRCLDPVDDRPPARGCGPMARLSAWCWRCCSWC